MSYDPMSPMSPETKAAFDKLREEVIAACDVGFVTDIAFDGEDFHFPCGCRWSIPGDGWDACAEHPDGCYPDALLPASPSPAEPTSAEEPPLGWVIVARDADGDSWTGSSTIFDSRGEAEDEIADMLADGDPNDDEERPVFTVEPVGRPTSAPGERIEGWAWGEGLRTFTDDRAYLTYIREDIYRPATLILHPPAPPTEEPRARPTTHEGGE